VQLLRTDDSPDAVLLFFRACGRGDLYRALRLQAWDEARLRSRVVAPLLRVLAKLHAMGYVHRDIKCAMWAALLCSQRGAVGAFAVLLCLRALLHTGPSTTESPNPSGSCLQPHQPTRRHPDHLNATPTPPHRHRQAGEHLL